jgi:hypothetical protein
MANEGRQAAAAVVVAAVTGAAAKQDPLVPFRVLGFARPRNAKENKNDDGSKTTCIAEVLCGIGNSRMQFKARVYYAVSASGDEDVYLSMPNKGKPSFAQVFETDDHATSAALDNWRVQAVQDAAKWLNKENNGAEIAAAAVSTGRVKASDLGLKMAPRHVPKQPAAPAAAAPSA